LNDLEAVIGADVFQNSQQAAVVLGKIIDVREQVDHDVEAEHADQADQISLQIAADQQAIE
jgi:hypothetical protein